jgi:hypothetical protein
MRIAIRTTVFVLMTLAIIPMASAQTPQDSRITVAHPGFTLLKSDLKKVLDLTSAVEQKQWENIQGYIDMFIIGVDETREVQVQVMTGIYPTGYLICVPLQSASDPSKLFRENLDSLGYKIMRNPEDHKLYTIESDANEYGWMKVDADLRYAFFMITTDKALLPKLKEIVVKAALTPTTLNDNMIAELKNTDASPEAVTHRTKAFKPIRDENMALIKQRPDEKATAFQLRQSSARQLYDEAQRIMSESDQMLVTLTLDRTNLTLPKVNLRTTVSAIPGTAMETTIAQYGTQTDAFAGSARLPGTAMSLRANHPLDELRKKHIKETLALTKADIEASLTSKETLSESERKAFSKFVTGILGVLESSVDSGHLNGAVESIPEGDDHFTTVGGFVSAAAADLNTILPLLAEAGKGNSVQMNLEKVGDVDIHKIQIAEGFISTFDRLFGTHEDLFVGIGPQKVWLATGKDGLKMLKTMIPAVGEPAANPVVLRIEGNMLPWAELFDSLAKKEKTGTLTADEEKIRREQARVRERAIAAMATEDDFSLVITTEGGMWIGEFTSNTGLLRFVGKMMSAFSKENFE